MIFDYVRVLLFSLLWNSQKNRGLSSISATSICSSFSECFLNIGRSLWQDYFLLQKKCLLIKISANWVRFLENLPRDWWLLIWSWSVHNQSCRLLECLFFYRRFSRAQFFLVFLKTKIWWTCSKKVLLSIFNRVPTLLALLFFRRRWSSRFFKNAYREKKWNWFLFIFFLWFNDFFVTFFAYYFCGFSFLTN